MAYSQAEIDAINRLPDPGFDWGVASGGTTTTLTDSTKGWSKNQWFGGQLIVSIGGTEYRGTISGNTTSIISLNVALPVPVGPGNPYRLKSTTRQVASGQTRPGIALNQNQQLVQLAAYFVPSLTPTPYPIPWVQPELAAGGSSHLYNVETGVATPYLVPAGYSLTIFEARSGFSQLSYGLLLFDNLIVGEPLVDGPGQPDQMNSITGYSTTALDPTSTSAHEVDFQVFNTGSSAAFGGAAISAVLEKVS